MELILRNNPTIYRGEDLQQRTPEWREIRVGKITATSYRCLLVDGDYDFGFGKAANNMAKRIAMQRINGVTTPDENPFKTAALRRGIELEKVAKKLYALETFSKVIEIGFVDCGAYGFSPDAFVDDFKEIGLMEIKNYTNAEKHFDVLVEGENGHHPQIQFGLYSSKLPWCDFVSHYPENTKKRIAINRHYPDSFAFAVIDMKLTNFNKLVEMKVQELQEAINR